MHMRFSWAFLLQEDFFEWMDGVLSQVDKDRRALIATVSWAGRYGEQEMRRSGRKRIVLQMECCFQQRATLHNGEIPKTGRL